MNKQRDQNGNATPSRRGFLFTSAGAAMGGTAALGQLNSKAEAKTILDPGKLKITVAGYQYDRVEGLIDGRVKVEGCDTKYEVSSIGEMNTHALSGPKTRTVSEIGLLPYILALANDGQQEYTLLPVFPLRVFRHKSIFIRNDRRITKPTDLRGKKVAIAGYSSTSLTWIRGIMQHEYGVTPEEINWVVSSRESSAKASGGASRWEIVRPKGISITTGPKEKDESELLVDGDVDAVFHAAEPRAFQEGHPKVARLFADSRKAERTYFAKTGIFPIMHAVAVRRDVIQTHPWLPKALFDSFSRAKQLTYDYMTTSAWYKTSLPWVAQEAEETRKLMGDNYWPYGIEPNRKALKTLLQFSHEQGLARRKLTIEEMFHASTLGLIEKPA